MWRESTTDKAHCVFCLSVCLSERLEQPLHEANHGLWLHLDVQRTVTFSLKTFNYVGFLLELIASHCRKFAVGVTNTEN
jgi:hypothetical protein